jgi:hypothetical protein
MNNLKRKLIESRISMRGIHIGMEKSNIPMSYPTLRKYVSEPKLFSVEQAMYIADLIDRNMGMITFKQLFY